MTAAHAPITQSGTDSGRIRIAKKVVAVTHAALLRSTVNAYMARTYSAPATTNRITISRSIVVLFLPWSIAPLPYDLVAETVVPLAPEVLITPVPEPDADPDAEPVLVVCPYNDCLAADGWIREIDQATRWNLIEWDTDSDTIGVHHDGNGGLPPRRILLRSLHPAGQPSGGCGRDHRVVVTIPPVPQITA